MLDRSERAIAVAPTDIASVYLRNRAREPVTSQTRLDRAFLFDALHSCPELTESDVPGAAERLRRHRERADRLWAWLDA
jgi:hypothetical protein